MKTWSLSIPQASESGGTSRITCIVAGEPLWFESPTHGLRPSMEAFAGLMLVPALHGRITLELEGAVDPVWLANAGKLLPIYHRWWGYPEKLPFTPRISPVSGQTRSARTALCFSGGADSFHTLFRHRERIKGLMFAEGFDVALNDTNRLNMCRQILRDVAAHFGMEAILIRSNLREHPAFCHLDWLRTHGGAIAAAGHLLARHFGTLMVSSSYNIAAKKPCGSHWQTDAFHASETFMLEHFGEHFHRTGKMEETCREPVVQKHLRVCWENRNEKLNCGICEKCVRTMVILHNFGVLESYTVFDHDVDLADRVKKIPGGLSEGVLMIWRRVYRATSDPELRRAIRDFALLPSPESLRVPPWHKAPLTRLKSTYLRARRRLYFR